MRGCWRLIRRDPGAADDFNLTIDGFWQSFAMILPVLVLAYPMFLSGHSAAVASHVENGETPPELRLGADYLYLLVGIVVWPLVAALLARLLGVAQNYVPYMIVYNWMTVPTMALAVIPHLIHLMTGSILPLALPGLPIFAGLLYVGWYVAKTCLRTTSPVAFAFLIADYALSYGLNALTQ